MPLQKIPLTELLKQRDYEAFYQVIHSLSEGWLAMLTPLVMPCAIVKRLAVEHVKFSPPLPPELLAPIQPALARIDTFYAQAVMFPNNLRCLLWAGGCVDGKYQMFEAGFKSTEEINRKRWRPYDEAAWDRFFEEIMACLSPALPLYDALPAEMHTLLMLLPETDNERIRRVYQYASEIQDLSVSKAQLQDSLNPAIVKASLWWSA